MRDIEREGAARYEFLSIFHLQLTPYLLLHSFASSTTELQSATLHRHTHFHNVRIGVYRIHVACVHPPFCFLFPFFFSLFPSPPPQQPRCCPLHVRFQRLKNPANTPTSMQTSLSASSSIFSDQVFFFFFLSQRERGLRRPAFIAVRCVPASSVAVNSA